MIAYNQKIPISRKPRDHELSKVVFHLCGFQQCKKKKILVMWDLRADLVQKFLRYFMGRNKLKLNDNAW